MLQMQESTRGWISAPTVAELIPTLGYRLVPFLLQCSTKIFYWSISMLWRGTCIPLVFSYCRVLHPV